MASDDLPVGQAIVLGLLHGPAELLPISSSGHIAVVPWLAGWDYSRLDDELRKSFEVALHTGTAAALLISLRHEVDEAVRGLNPRRMLMIALSFAPPAFVGYRFERPIERYLGTPPTVACGLFVGALAMALADRSPQERTHSDAGAADALWLGVAQACSLFPGVSRNGATLAAARWRRFTRVDANRLSRHAALPIIAGATLLKGVRLRNRGMPPGAALPFVAGAGAAFVSTLASTRLIRALERDSSLLPYALYRIALAGVIAGSSCAARGLPRVADPTCPERTAPPRRSRGNAERGRRRRAGVGCRREAARRSCVTRQSSAFWLTLTYYACPTCVVRHGQTKPPQMSCYACSRRDPPPGTTPPHSRCLPLKPPAVTGSRGLTEITQTRSTPPSRARRSRPGRIAPATRSQPPQLGRRPRAGQVTDRGDLGSGHRPEYPERSPQPPAGPRRPARRAPAAIAAAASDA